MSAVPSLAEQRQAHIERQRRLGMVSAPVVRLDLIRPSPKPMAVPPPPPAPEPVKAETREEFIQLPDFLPVGRRALQAVFRQAESKVILNVVSRLSGVSVHDIKSQRRTGEVIIPRQVACWAMHRLTPLSLPRIGKAMGGRDHSTILHAVRKIEELRKSSHRVLTFSDEVFSEARHLLREQGSYAGETE